MMTRLIQRTALRLFSAGVFSFCSLTIVTPLVADPPAAQSKVRHEAIKVELALLGDAHAYAQPLTVRATADGIEVQGTVGSEAIQRHVLQVARRSTHLPIHDRISIAGTYSSEARPLVDAARGRLVRELGAQVDAIEIQFESGKLKLTGKVRSEEDKLHASRTLRGLTGCTGLVNELEVQVASGPSFTLVGHADQDAQTAPVAPGVTSAPAPTLVPEAYTRVSPPTARPAPMPSAPPANRVLSAQVTTTDRGREQAHTVMYVVPTSNGSTIYPAGQSAPVVVPEKPRLWDRFRLVVRHESEANAPAVMESPTEVIRPVPPVHRFTPVKAESPVAVPETTPNTGNWPPAYRTAPVTTPTPSNSLYQSRPLSNLTRPATSAGLAPTPQRPQPTQAVGSGPTEVTPLAAQALVTQQSVAPKVVSADLVRKVKAVSGSHARNVRVETGADGVLAVHVYATAGSEQLLTAKLFDVPELTQSNVRLHVHIAP